MNNKSLKKIWALYWLLHKLFSVINWIGSMTKLWIEFPEKMWRERYCKKNTQINNVLKSGHQGASINIFRYSEIRKLEGLVL